MLPTNAVGYTNTYLSSSGVIAHVLEISGCFLNSTQSQLNDLAELMLQQPRGPQRPIYQRTGVGARRCARRAWNEERRMQL
jgi:hypothetical protein